jgi:hypothetical protein
MKIVDAKLKNSISVKIWFDYLDKSYYKQKYSKRNRVT